MTTTHHGHGEQPGRPYTPEQLAAAAALGVSVETMSDMLCRAILDTLDEVLAGAPPARQDEQGTDTPS